jgi:hypothetical protein
VIDRYVNRYCVQPSPVGFLVHRERAPISTSCHHLPSNCVLPFFNILKQPALNTLRYVLLAPNSILSPGSLRMASLNPSSRFGEPESSASTVLRRLYHYRPRTQRAKTLALSAIAFLVCLWLLSSSSRVTQFLPPIHSPSLILAAKDNHIPHRLLGRHSTFVIAANPQETPTPKSMSTPTLTQRLL